MKIALVILLFPLLSFANLNDCRTGLLKEGPVLFSMGQGKRLSDGTFEVLIDYTHKTPGQRRIHLPSAIANFKYKKDLRVLILAGNSGDAYEGTRHNLAFTFGDYLLKKHPFVAKTSSNEIKPESVLVTLDDGSSRMWTHKFQSERGSFRTDSGEFFFLPSFNSKPTLIVRPIGDYNEIGDFAVPLIELLDIAPHQMALIHDDLRLGEGLFGHNKVGPQKADGNNAVFSMNRALSYGAIRTLISTIETEHPNVISKTTLPRFHRDFEERAAIRQSEHLGQERALDQAFKGTDAVLAATRPLAKHVSEVQTADLQQTIIFEQANLKVARSGLQEIMRKLNSSDVSESDRHELREQQKQILEKTKPIAQEIKRLEKEIANIETETSQQIKKLIEAKMSFVRIRIGTDDGSLKERASFADFVLGKSPEQVFNDQKWAELEKELAEILK